MSESTKERTLITLLIIITSVIFVIALASSIVSTIRSRFTGENTVLPGEDAATVWGQTPAAAGETTLLPGTNTTVPDTTATYTPQELQRLQPQQPDYRRVIDGSKEEYRDFMDRTRKKQALSPANTLP